MDQLTDCDLSVVIEYGRQALRDCWVIFDIMYSTYTMSFTEMNLFSLYIFSENATTKKVSSVGVYIVQTEQIR